MLIGILIGAAAASAILIFNFLIFLKLHEKEDDSERKDYDEE